MFVRAKTVKGKKYGYLVQNVWKKGKVKQQVKKYLGRIISIPPIQNTQTTQINFSLPKKTIIQQLLATNLLQRGFEKKRGEVYQFEDIKVNLTKGTIKQDDKDIVFNIDDRYVYGKLLREITDFYEPESDDDTPGQKLAQAFSDIGIAIDKEDFVKLYKKLYL